MLRFDMALDGTARRRWVGVAALSAALGMLVGGQTVLQSRLEGAAYILYWLLCFGFTFLAMLIALWDVRSLRTRSRREERELLHSTLEKIVDEAKAREGKDGKG